MGGLLVALKLGSEAIGFQQLFAGLLQSQSDTYLLVMKIRLPQALNAFVIGGLLGLAGCYLQVLLQNPLADPYILGVSGGTAFANLLAIHLGLSGLLLHGSAIVGAGLAMALVWLFAYEADRWSSTRVLLYGVILAMGWGALITLLLVISPDSRLPGMLFWLVGDLTTATLPVLPFFILVCGILFGLIHARGLDLLVQGEQLARSLGVNTARLAWQLYFVSAVMIAVAVMMVGCIGFIGLIIPHCVRLLLGFNHRQVVLATVLLGGALLMYADTLSRTIIAPQQLPVGVITAIIGVPLFMILMRRQS